MSEQGLLLVESFDDRRGSAGRTGTLSELAQPIRSVATDLTTSQLDEMFRRDDGLRWVALTGGAAPILVQRSTFESLLTGRLGYGRLLHGRRRVGDLPHPPTLALAEDTAIVTAATLLINNRQLTVGPGDALGPDGWVGDRGPTGVSAEGVLVTRDGEAVRVVAVSDIFERLALHFAHQAMHDPLTGLPNRLHLMQRLAQVTRSGDRAALLYLDLDRFKDINDQHGHAAGDQVLVQFGERLRSVSRADDLVARLGGDEFAVLSFGAMTAAQSRVRAERVVLMAAAPFLVTVTDEQGTLHEREVYVGASVGVARSDQVVPDPSVSSAEVMLKHADLAMYRAKRHGRGRVEQFDRVLMPSEADARATQHQRNLERRLRAAIDDGLLKVHFQPVVALAEARVVGAEALVRWDDGELGPVSPEEFITLAERTGLILGLGRWVLGEACAQAAQWKQSGTNTPWVSVNVSPVELSQPGIVDQVAMALSRSGLAPQRLCLEVTETAAIEDCANTARRLEQLSALGVRIALDDFGTGHSSLTMLRDLPVDIVKIDRSFVQRIANSAGDAVLVRLVIETAHSLGITVCAEGIEDPAQARQLAALGCDSAQGWHFGKPQPSSAQLHAVLGELVPANWMEGAEGSRASMLIPGTEELVLVTTADGVITYASSTVRSMLGWAPAELTGRSVLPHLHPQDRSACLAALAAPTDTLTHRVRHRDGSYRWLQSSVQHLVGADGALAQVLSLSRDVTETVGLRMDLRRTEQQCHQVWDYVPLAVTRPDGTFLRVNSAFARILGRSTSEVLSMSVDELTHPNERRVDVRPYPALLLAGAAGAPGTRLLHVDGHPVNAQVFASPVSESGDSSSVHLGHVAGR